MERILIFLKKYNLLYLKSLEKLSGGVCEWEDYCLIDFDMVKKELSRSLKQRERDSCDGLYIEERNVYAIEFKSIRAIFDNYYKTRKHGDNFKKFLNKLKRNPFEKKIKGSLFFLEYILYHTEVFNKKDETNRIVYYIVTDVAQLNPSEQLLANWNLLATGDKFCFPTENFVQVKRELEKVVNITKRKLACFGIEVRYFTDCMDYLKTKKYFKDSV